MKLALLICGVDLVLMSLFGIYAIWFDVDLDTVAKIVWTNFFLMVAFALIVLVIQFRKQ